MPTSRKPKTARTLKSKRQNTQRLAANKISKPTPRTSQALRQAAPLSRKKAKKLDKKIGFAKKRALEEAGEVEMKDVGDTKAGRRAAKAEAREKEGKGEGEEEKMEVDEVL